MGEKEKDLKYKVVGFIGTVVDKDGESPVILIESDEATSGEAIAQDLTEKTGEVFRHIADIRSDGTVKSFGFSNWKGSTWVPEGPKPNWIDPKKSN